MRASLARALLLVVASTTSLLLAPALGASCYDELYSREDYPMCKNLAPELALHWKVEDGFITFAAVLDGKWTWTAIGLSEGGLHGADLWVVKNEQAIAGSAWSAGDYWAQDWGQLVSDDVQDVTMVGTPTQSMTQTVILLQRRLSTCDSVQDLPIFADTDQVMVFSYGVGNFNPATSITRDNLQQTILRLNPGLEFNQTVATNTTASYYLDLYSRDPPDLARMELRMPDVQVPQAPTTYMCVNLVETTPVGSDPFQKYHVIRFQGVAGPLVYHMVLWGCVKRPEPLGKPYTCMGTVPPECSILVAGWAPGMGNVSLPFEAGIPIGGNSSTSFTHFTLQIHYNNQNATTAMDNSGIRLYYTPTLRANDAAWLTLGTRNFAPIPAGASNFTIPRGVCPTDCINARLGSTTAVNGNATANATVASGNATVNATVANGNATANATVANGNATANATVANGNAIANATVANGNATANATVPNGNGTAVNSTSPSVTKLHLDSQVFYMKGAGSRIITRHIRHGTEIQPLGYRNWFDDENQYPQTVLPESRDLLPGDSLITECTYNTSLRTTPTPNGYAASTEACYAYVIYYPALPSFQDCSTMLDSAGVATSLCGGSVDLANVSQSYTNMSALLQAGLAFPTPSSLSYAPYAPVCDNSPPPAPKVYKTGAAVTSIILVNIILLGMGVLLWVKVGSKEDPERLQLLREAQQALQLELAAAERGAASRQEVQYTRL